MECAQSLHPDIHKALRHPAGKEGDHCDANEERSRRRCRFYWDLDVK